MSVEGQILFRGTQPMADRGSDTNDEPGDGDLREFATSSATSPAIKSRAAAKMQAQELRAFFGESEVLKGITLPILEKKVTVGSPGTELEFAL